MVDTIPNTQASIQQTQALCWQPVAASKAALLTTVDVLNSGWPLAGWPLPAKTGRAQLHCNAGWLCNCKAALYQPTLICQSG